jgi:hypothetical protein
VIEARTYWARSRHHCRQIADEIMRLDVGQGRIAEIIVRPPRKEKTHDQRKLFHAVCSDIGLELGLTPGQVKEMVKQDFYGFEKIRVGRRVYKFVQSSEESDRAEYSRLVDYTYIWSAERGVLVQDRRPKP